MTTILVLYRSLSGNAKRRAESVAKVIEGSVDNVTANLKGAGKTNSLGFQLGCCSPDQQ